MTPTGKLDNESMKGSSAFNFKPGLYEDHKPLLLATKIHNWSEAAGLARNLRGRAFKELVNALNARMAKANADRIIETSLERRLRAWKELKKTKKGRLKIAQALAASGKSFTKEQIAMMLSDRYLSVLIKVPTSSIFKRNYQEFWGWLLDTGSLGFHAGLVSEIQLSINGRKIDSLRTVYEDILKSSKDIQYEISKRLMLVHTYLQLEDIASIQENCVSLLAYLEENLGKIAVFTANAYLAREDGFSRRGIKSEEKWGMLSLHAAKTVRLSIWSYVTAFYLAIITAAGQHSKQFIMHRQKALDFKFSSVAPQGKIATCSQLMAHPEKFENKFVKVTGFVDKVRIFQETATKQSSAIDLVDKAKNIKIPVILPFRNIARTGVVSGCFVSINGTFYKSKKDNNWRIRLDTLNYSDYRKNSWIDLLVDDIKHWTNLLPGGLNFLYSLDGLNTLGEISGLEELSRYRPKRLVLKKSRTVEV